MYKYKKPVVAWGKVPIKSRTVPDQSMSIKELVRRFVRGIPADVIQREAVYVDQKDTDLEKLSRMDNCDKAYEALEMRAINERIIEEVEAMQRASEAKKQADEKARVEKASGGAGIVSLDNTMPVDTGLIPNQLGVSKK